MRLNTLLGLLAAICLGLIMSNVACFIAFEDMYRGYQEELASHYQSDTMLSACQAREK